MDEIAVSFAAAIGLAAGYGLGVWRRIPVPPVVEDIIDFVSIRKPPVTPVARCQHSFTQRLKDGWHCDKCHEVRVDQ